ncbi:MAG TPA: LysR substrate-binding domain-containing protein [Gammaproteobacteria bacterium]|nr:LysR substrate-binding domain-containing protein [Gammaproteobacteria bacterium]
MTLRLNLEALIAMDAIDRHKNFADAARALHKVPSALTYTIQKLEQDLDVLIFDRRGHRAKLTPAGMHLLKEGRKLLEQSAVICDETKHIAHGREAQITMAVDTIISIETLIPLIKKFHTAFPTIKLRIQEHALNGTWETLADNRADIIIAASHQQIPGNYQLKKLAKIAFSLCVTPTHPFAKTQKPITTEELEKETIILIADSSMHFTPRTIGFDTPLKSITFTTMEQKIHAQTEGLGIGFLPKSRIKHLLKDKSLIAVPTTHPRPPADIYLAWRNNNTGIGVQWLVEHIHIKA